MAAVAVAAWLRDKEHCVHQFIFMEMMNHTHTASNAIYGSGWRHQTQTLAAGEGAKILHATGGHTSARALHICRNERWMNNLMKHGL